MFFCPSFRFTIKVIEKTHDKKQEFSTGGGNQISALRVLYSGQQIFCPPLLLSINMSPECLPPRRIPGSTFSGVFFI